MNLIPKLLYLVGQYIRDWVSVPLTPFIFC